MTTRCLGQEHARESDEAGSLEEIDHPDGNIPLHHFLRTSVSLRTVDILAWGETPEQDLGATNVLEAVSHNKSVVSLCVTGTSFRKPLLIENVLVSSQTLTESTFIWEEGLGNSSVVVQALRCGLQQNKSFETVKLELSQGPQVPEVLLGVLSLRNLRKLTLKFIATEASSVALRFFLAGNVTLETLLLSVACPFEEASSAMTALLLGLASNRGLKSFILSGSILKGEYTHVCSNAWTEIFAKNSTQKVFGARDCDLGEAYIGSSYASAIARGGLSKNGSLQSIDLGRALLVNACDRPMWRNALEKNNTLVELDLGFCNTRTCPDFASFTQGLACNKSLKVLKLQSNAIANSKSKMTQEGMVELAAGLRNNSRLRELDLAHCEVDDEMLIVLGESLQVNATLESLDIRGNNFDDEGKIRFFGLLPRMKGLKKLAINIANHRDDITIHAPEDSLVEAIVEGVRLNQHQSGVDL